jgi:hypothetical protein
VLGCICAFMYSSICFMKFCVLMFIYNCYIL